MLQKARELLAIILVALLPFHALAVTVLTKVIAGPNHAPLSVLAGWKEVMLVIILLVALIEWVKTRPWNISIDWIDGLILLLIVLAVIVDMFNHTGKSQMLLGFKYDLLPLIALFVARRVPWTTWFTNTVMTAILWVGGIVAVYGIISFFLPPQFFYWLGYSDATSLYIPNGPLAAFQQIEGLHINRIQSTLSGPNQLGIWLLLPISVALSCKFWTVSNGRKILVLTTLGASLIALLMSFCRSAWVATVVILLIAAFPWIRSHMTRRAWIGSAIVVILLVTAAVALFPGELVRVSSTRGHLDKPILALEQMVEHPLGQGLGSAGPATNHFSDTCVMLRPQDDPSWAKSQPNLCVFLGTRQVQPTDRACSCPFLPENWYLQIGVELGWIGLIAFLALTILITIRLLRSGEGKQLFLMFLGISIAALFLHAWEDAAVAYSVWLMIAAVLKTEKKKTA